MNEVALEIIRQIGDELSLLREEVRTAKKLLAKRDAEIKQLQSQNFWYGEWVELHTKCIEAGLIEKPEETTTPLPF